MIINRILKKVKNQEGFTLVEVIVVAVIVAVLAAVAIPIYLSYVEDSRINQSDNVAGAVASFCGACATNGGDCPATLVGKQPCVPAGGTTATINIPADITVKNAGGVITAKHVKADSSSQPYSYK